MAGKIKAARLRILGKTYEKDGIVTDGGVLRCKYCDVPVFVDEKHQKIRVDQHIKTPKHGGNKARSEGTASKTQPFLAAALNSSKHQQRSEFNHDLTAALLRSGIPLNKVSYIFTIHLKLILTCIFTRLTVNHPSFKSFLEEYCKKSVPCESTLRRVYVNPVYKETIDKLKSVVADYPVLFEMDETTDEKGRFVLNVLVAPLSSSTVKPMLLKMFHLEKTNSATVMQSFITSCNFLWPSGIPYEKVWLILTDQASYMLSACEKLKGMFPNLLHVTCLAHALHRVCESVQVEYSRANDFVNEMKKVLLKSPARIMLYQQTTALPLPPQPIVIRWGTWINAATFYAENFDKLTEFIEAIEDQAVQ